MQLSLPLALGIAAVATGLSVKQMRTPIGDVEQQTAVARCTLDQILALSALAGQAPAGPQKVRLEKYVADARSAFEADDFYGCVLNIKFAAGTNAHLQR